MVAKILQAEANQPVDLEVIDKLVYQDLGHITLKGNMFEG